MSDRDMEKIKKGEGISKEVPRVDPGKSDTEKRAGLRVAEGNNDNEITAKSLEEMRARLRRRNFLDQLSKHNGMRVAYRESITPKPKRSGTRSVLRNTKIVMRRSKKNRIEG